MTSEIPGTRRAQCGIYEALWLARLHAVSAHALYLHIPFCARKCAYCDFLSWQTSRGDACLRDYVDALVRQIEEAGAAGLLAGVETAYVGGGTPSLLGADLLGRVVRTVREHAPRVRELTVEANPDSLSDGVLDAMAAAGATRLSVGVQSLCDDELVALGRLHTAAQAQGRVLAAVRQGLDVSVDLMCAIPRQTDASWRLTLQKVLALGVGHVSVYPLQIEGETPLGRLVGDDEPAWHDGEVQATRMELAEDLLTGAGFHRYEVASYALPDKECQHNQRYWTGRPYLGLGLGASSMLTREGYEALRGVCPQLPRVGDGVERIRLCVRGARAESLPTLAQTGFDLEFLDGAQAAAEDLMLGMRMSVGVDKGLLEHARRVLGSDEVNAAFEACARRGLVQWAEGRYAPTHEGWLLGNELYGTLWDLAPGEVVQSRALVQKPAV